VDRIQAGSRRIIEHVAFRKNEDGRFIHIGIAADLSSLQVDEWPRSDLFANEGNLALRS
jgi:hypothetical protein